MEANSTAGLEMGYMRLAEIVGDPRRGIKPVIPVSRSTWWEKCRKGEFPAPVKLGPNTTAWRRSDILALVARLGRQA